MSHSNHVSWAQCVVLHMAMCRNKIVGFFFFLFFVFLETVSHCIDCTNLEFVSLPASRMIAACAPLHPTVLSSLPLGLSV